MTKPERDSTIAVMTEQFKLPHNEVSLSVAKDGIEDQTNHFIRLPKTAGEAALLMEVARDTGVIADQIDDPEVAANAYASYLYLERLEKQRGFSVASEDLSSKSRSYAETARQVVTNGGALIEFYAYGTQDLKEFFRVLAQKEAKREMN